LRASAPVWIGEWGDVPPRGDAPREAYDFGGYASDLLGYADARAMTWLAWVWHDAWYPSLVDPLETATPTRYGERVRAALSGEMP
jgi:hypothetical protein